MLSTNPFSGTDADRTAIWNMLVQRDIQAYCQANWQLVEKDFLANEFFAVNAGNQADPGKWNLAFSSLEQYRDEWLRQAKLASDTEYAEPLEDAVHAATRLDEIEIADGRAIARKQFNGEIKKTNGEVDILLWQTLYYLKKTEDGWKICGFTGYLPYTA